MTTQTEALKLALEALERLHYEMFTQQGENAITAIKEALAQPEQEPDADICPTCAALSKDFVEPELSAQPEQEPVAHFGSAYVNENGVHITTVLGPVAIPQDAKLYTTPPQRTWVGLTDDEIRHIYICTTGWSISDSDPMLVDFAEAIEAKLKEKNN